MIPAKNKRPLYFGFLPPPTARLEPVQSLIELSDILSR
jgi:hypothetical protein